MTPIYAALVAESGSDPLAERAVVAAAEALLLLDFEVTVTCDGKAGNCPNPAALHVEHRCPDCGYHVDGAEGLVCEECWAGASRKTTICASCLTLHEHRDAWRVVGRVA